VLGDPADACRGVEDLASITLSQGTTAAQQLRAQTGRQARGGGGDSDTGSSRRNNVSAVLSMPHLCVLRESSLHAESRQRHQVCAGSHAECCIQGVKKQYADVTALLLS
jgi:hypothetical protein